MTPPARTRSDIGRSSARKGQVAERAVASYLRVVGFPHAERAVRSGFTTAERSYADHGDITGVPGLVIQVKAYANPRPTQVAGWLADTEAQRAAAHAEVGLLVVKRPRAAHPGSWWACLYLADLAGLVGGSRAGTDPLAWVQVELAAVLLLLRQAGYGQPLADDEVPVRVLLRRAPAAPHGAPDVREAS